MTRAYIQLIIVSLLLPVSLYKSSIFSSNCIVRIHYNQINTLQSLDYDVKGRLSLAVLSVAEQKTGDNVTLSCSLTSPDNCVSETVKWLYNNKDIDGKNTFMKTPPAPRCSAAVTIVNLTHSNISTYNFTCRVTTWDNQVHFFDFSPQSAGK